MTCQFAHLDGVYVLGSLAASERADYERHLPGCAECSRSVREVAGLPGLMARVPVEVLQMPRTHEPAPATLLPAVVSAARRSRRRRVTAGAIIAAAVAIVALGISGVLLAALDGDDNPPAAGPTVSLSTAPADRMESLGAGWVTGWVSLTEQRWGTRIDLDCDYAATERADWVSYAMVVRGTDGTVSQVGTWRAQPGGKTRVTMATSVSPDDIESLEVRTAQGQPVLRLRP